MELSCSLGTTRHVPREKFPHKPNNKSFIDQVSSVKMAGCTVSLHPQIAKANRSGQSYTEFFVQIGQTQSHFDNTIAYGNIFAFSIVKRVNAANEILFKLSGSKNLGEIHLQVDTRVQRDHNTQQGNNFITSNYIYLCSIPEAFNLLHFKLIWLKNLFFLSLNKKKKNYY